MTENIKWQQNDEYHHDKKQHSHDNEDALNHMKLAAKTTEPTAIDRVLTNAPARACEPPAGPIFYKYSIFMYQSQKFDAYKNPLGEKFSAGNA